VTRDQKLAVMGLGYVGLPESGCSMSGVPLDPPKDYGDIPPPGICCFPRECEGIGEADKPPHNALKKLVGATGIKPVTLTMSIFGRTFSVPPWSCRSHIRCGRGR
jgi:hypothetical protein